MARRIRILVGLTLLAGVAGVAASALLWLFPEAALAAGGTAADAAGAGPPGNERMWAFITAALATGISSLGAAYAVAQVGSAAVGAVSEKPEVLGKVVILVGLAEGIAIYGLIVSILILNKLG